ncbi:MAG: phosphatidylinositol-specific phospholipase C domain-containing protein [Bacilli bacterium]|nr:phosphatidylinositol-specific phospholipase C domain-containing protein [Bacilli bacterium]
MTKTNALSIGAGVLGLLVVGAGGYFGFGKFGTSVDESRSEWMKGVADETAIRSLAIPGTHDSAALYGIGNLSGQCQTIGIEDQLKLGVRFFDIRLQNRNDELVAVHGIVDQKLKFSQIVSTIDDFLAHHPSEFLIVSIKEESDPKGASLSFQQALEKQLTVFWRKETTLPSQVKEVRGKAVILSRFASSTIGIPAYEGWKDSTSFALPNDIYVQDTYKTDVETKKKEILSCFQETGHAWKINFLSGYSPTGFPPSYAPSIAKEINSWIDTVIPSYEDKGIVLYDFITKERMDAFFGGKQA